MRILNHSAAMWPAAIVVAALCAGAVTDARPPAGHGTAGLGMMQLLDDEHALVARATAEQNDRQRAEALAANLALMQEKNRTVVLAMAVEDPPLHLAETRPAVPAKLSPPRHSPPAPRGAVKLARGPDTAPPIERPPGPPLVLQATLTTPAMAKPQQPQGGLLRRVHDVVDTVERVPGWVNDAVDWIVALPAQAIPRRLRAARLNVML